MSYLTLGSLKSPWWRQGSELTVPSGWMPLAFIYTNDASKVPAGILVRHRTSGRMMRFKFGSFQSIDQGLAARLLQKMSHNGQN